MGAMRQPLRALSLPLVLALALATIPGCESEETPPPSSSTAANPTSKATPQRTAPIDQPAGHMRMVAALEDLAVRSRDENKYQGDGRARRWRAALAQLPADAPVKERLRLLRQSGMAELRAGNEQESIRILTEAVRLLPQARAQINRLQAAEVVYRLGVAYMRMGETENCCNRFTPDSCVMPIRGGGIHKDPTGSRGAIEQFQQVMRMVPADNDMSLTSRWLMNVAYMTLDEHPDKVPPEYLIPRERFKSTVEFPRLMNVGQDLGLARYNCSGSVIIDDLTGDGPARHPHLHLGAPRRAQAVRPRCRRQVHRSNGRDGARGYRRRPEHGAGRLRQRRRPGLRHTARGVAGRGRASSQFADSQQRRRHLHRRHLRRRPGRSVLPHPDGRLGRLRP